MLGLLTSFHSLVYAYTRQLFGLARTGHLPSFMGRVTHMRKAPIISLLFGSVIGLAVNVAIYFLSTSQGMHSVL